MDALDELLAEKRARARERLIEALREPVCRCCGHALSDEWMTAFDLKAAVYAAPEWEYGDHASIGLALYDLIDEGVVERRASDHKVRLKP